MEIWDELEKGNWPGVAGFSVLGRPLRYCIMGSGPVSTLVIGAIHGDEQATAELAIKLALELEAPGAADGLTVAILPIANPDGYFLGGKDNARGVDLNRNFPTADHGQGLAPGYDPGPRGGSEPETRALLSLWELCLRPRILALHAPLAVINYDGPGADWAAQVAEAANFEAVGDIGYPTPGSMGTHVGREKGIPILTYELGRERLGEAWNRHREGILTAVQYRS